MSLRILIDMNLSPDWVTYLQQHGWDAIHWVTVGDPHAYDSVLMDWARQNRCVVFTHDLDFGTALALTHASGPSVIQLRGQDVFPDQVGSSLQAALTQHRDALAAGALMVIDVKKCRVRLLPL
jgi:predicted nuclease of predicted toxin-antitoxin system